jgi:hypothetical protein
MFEQLLGNVESMAEKLGLPADQVKSLIESATSKLGDGGDHMQALTSAAAEHGLSLDSIQGLLGNLGGAEGIMGKVTEMLGGAAGEGENAAGGLLDMAKGLFK